MNKNIRNRFGRRKLTDKWIVFIFVFLVYGFLYSCVVIYLPPVWDGFDAINSEDSIRPGVTTKEEVLQRLGQPDAEDKSGKSIEYSGTKSGGLVMGLAPGAAGTKYINQKSWAVLIKFDDNNVVTSVFTNADLIREAKIYCANADLGYADAQLRIGKIYDYGVYGMKVDPVRAWVWYNLAAQNGDDVAMHGVTRLTAQLNDEQLAEAKRQLAAWKPGQCVQEMTSVDAKQEIK